MTETGTAVAPFDGEMEPGERRAALAMWKYSQQLAKAGLAGDLRGKPEDVYAVVAFADQFGIAPGNAIQMVWIIKGRLVPRSEFLSAICRKNGHELRFEESSSERCTVAIRRRGDDFWQRVTFTIEDAQRAGLMAKDTWKQFPQDMLCHATVRRAVKRICPDVLLGVDLGGDEGIDTRQYRPLDGQAEAVVDVELDWQEDAAPAAEPDPQPEGEIEDAVIVDGEPAPPAADAADAHKAAMTKLMVTCTKAFPEADAARGTKTRRQRLLRRAAQFAIVKEHRPASDLTTDELERVENWVYRRFLDPGATSLATAEIQPDESVAIRFDGKVFVVPPVDEPQAA